MGDGSFEAPLKLNKSVAQILIDIDSSLIALKENFHSTGHAEPASPKDGQIWFDDEREGLAYFNSGLTGGGHFLPIMHQLKEGQLGGGNAGAGEDDMNALTIHDGLFVHNLSGIIIDALVQCAANANNKTIKIYAGAVELISTGALALNDKWVSLRCKCMVNLPTTAQVFSTAWSDDAALLEVLSQRATFTVAPSTPGDTIYKITGEGTSNNDLICRGFRITGW